ncbi:YheC/YheD family protein [Effusibacillus lacus]|uniref:ATP-grasp domain-containing protein n=1 Tax=Effusibacillus lacus TaxID=1348429 RepID=A0A292YEN5_9BACL|nr:YheC/YheD family protein [Effusibacillus lacus]TCS76242.1 glutathione synthase/RimK-type ligase-like ATP-grasp enzyme [Effusibacillus lacus]GAX91792.1 hypothetical protein EFBL_3483 [Effusibacillus lacus]
MKRVPVTITSVSSEHAGDLFLAKNLCNELGILPGRHVIQCGGISRSVRVLFPMNERPSVCAFSPDVMESLALFEGAKLLLYTDGEKLRLGPVLGILANIRVKDGGIDGQQAPVFKHLLTLATEERMYAYLFSPQELVSDKLRGYVLKKTNEKMTWEIRDVPFPDVVYDQIITRKFENTPFVKTMKEKLIAKLGSAYFNPGYFDKVQVHDWLNSSDETKVYLPATIQHVDLKKTEPFLKKHNPVYFKPVNGTKGLGIIKLVRLIDGRYMYQVRGKNGIQFHGIKKSTRHVLNRLDRRLKRRPFIVQEGLQLKTYEGRPFDIRVLMQKDHTGKWRRTKMYCRVAQEGDFISNLSTGGDAVSVPNVLQKICTNQEEIRSYKKKIDKLVKLVPVVLEKASGMQLGELGLDIGIDAKGWVWLIEVNSKPWKKPFTEQGSMKLVVKSFRRPLLYGKYLAGITQ